MIRVIRKYSKAAGSPNMLSTIIKAEWRTLNKIINDQPVKNRTVIQTHEKCVKYSLKEIEKISEDRMIRARGLRQLKRYEKRIFTPRDQLLDFLSQPWNVIAPWDRGQVDEWKGKVNMG